MEQKRKGPRALTESERQSLMQHREEHKRKLEEDPEYRKRWEKMKAGLKRLFPIDREEGE